MPIDATLLLNINRLVGAAGDSDPSLEREIVVIAKFDRTLIATGAITPLRVATHEWATSPTDTPANTPYAPRLSGLRFAQSILNSDWMHAAGAVLTELQLLNIDGVLDADLDREVYGWHGAAFTLLAGLRNWTLSQFKPLPGSGGIVLDLQPGEEVARVVVQHDADRLDLPVQGRPAHRAGRYGGFQHAYDFAGTANCTYDNNGQPGLRSFTLHRRFRIAANPGAAAVICGNRNSVSTAAGTPGIVIFVNTSGQIRVIVDDGTNAVALSIGSAAEYVDDKWHGLDVTCDRIGDVLTGYVDGVADGTASIAAVTGSLTSTDPLRDGRLPATSGNFWTGKLDEARLWRYALTADQVRSRYLRAADGVEPGLVMCNPYDENTGTTNASLVRGPMYVQPVVSGAQSANGGTTICNPGSGSFAAVIWVREPAGGTGVALSRKVGAGAADAGYAISTSAAGSWQCVVSDGTTQVTASLGTGLDDDTEWGFGLVVDRVANELRAYRLDYPRGTLTLVSTASIAGLGSFGPAGVNFRVVAYSGGGTALTSGHAVSWAGFISGTADATAVRLALSEQWIEYDAQLPTAPPQLLGVAAGAHFWPLDELTGTTANDRIASGGVNLTWSSAPTRRTKDGTITSGISGAWIGTLEGGRDLRGLAKPVPLGQPQRFAPPLIDVPRRIYQYGDPDMGATQSVDEVFDAGEKLTLTTHYTVDLANSTITILAARTIVGDITMSCHGIKDVGGTKWLRYPGELVNAVWTRLLGVTAVNAASVTAYDEAHPYTQGLWLGPCDQTLQCVYDKLLSPDGYAYRNLANEMALGTRLLPVTGSTPVLELDETSISDVEALTGPPPTWLARVSFNNTISKIASFAPNSSLEQRQDATQGAMYAEDSRIEVSEKFPKAIERTYDTATARRPDAALLVQRMLDLDGADRQPWRVTLAKNHWALELGDKPVKITSYSRYNLAGKLYAAVGYEYGLEDGMPVSALTLWGGVAA